MKWIIKEFARFFFIDWDKFATLFLRLIQFKFAIIFLGLIHFWIYLSFIIIGGLDLGSRV